MRRQYKDLIIVGGIDKRALAKGKTQIDGEIEKARILLREGGYFPCVDDGIAPDVPYENSCYFMNELRKLMKRQVMGREVVVAVTRLLITTSRLGRRAGIGWDWHAIRNALQLVAGDEIDIAPGIATRVERLYGLNPAFFAPIEKV